MSNIIDEDLNTKPNLITEKYNFELTGLKDAVDVRKPSRNFLKIENLFSKIFSRKIKTGPGLQGEGNLENDLNLSIKSNDAVINISQENGIQLNKTDLTENDSNKLFTAKGALKLKNFIVENYTTYANNIRENLLTIMDRKIDVNGGTMLGTLIINRSIFGKRGGLYSDNGNIFFNFEVSECPGFKEKWLSDLIKDYFYSNDRKPTADDVGTYTKQEIDLRYSISIKDNRISNPLPKDFIKQNISFTFNNNNMPTSNWYSIITVKGWEDNYKTWQLAANSDNNVISDNGLWFRTSKTDSTWNPWQKINIAGKSDLLWSGGHYMDSGVLLTLNNIDFNNYQAIVLYVSCENTDFGMRGGNLSGQIFLPTAEYGNPSHNWIDLTGDDWAGAVLQDNKTIIPQSGAGVWIRRVYGIK